MCAFNEALDSDYSKKREYLKQQHQLRTMSKVNHAISADDMIENLLSKKEIFQKKKDPNPPKSPQCQPVLPEWLSPLQEPLLYRQVWARVAAPSGTADTVRLSSLLLTSRLSTETLGYIWSLANPSSAPALSQSQTYIVLALVALAQSGCAYTSSNVLLRLKEAPLPKLTLYEDKPQPQPPPVSAIQSSLADFSLKPSVVSDLQLQKSTADDFSLAQSRVDDFSPGKSTMGDFGVKQSSSIVDSFSFLDLQETAPPSLSLIDCSPTKTFTQENKTQPVKEPDILALGDDSFGDFQSVLPSTSATPQESAPSEEEEYDDFKSADFSTLTILEVKEKPNEEVAAPFFAEIKLPPPLEADKGPVEDLFPKCVVRSKEDEEGDPDFLADAPVPADRYSALRLLEVDLEPSKSSDQDEFGDFLTAEPPSPVQTPVLSNVLLTESHSNIQERCMLACVDLLEEAVKIFDSIEEEDVRNEVISDPKGVRYLEELVEVERIALRIKVSFQKEELVERLEAALDALTCYLDPHRHSYAEEEKGAKCGICLSERGPTYVKYGINNFHAPCANLYLHKVDRTLPIAPTI